MNTECLPLNQQPDWNARANDARLAAAYIGMDINSREGLPKIAGDYLQQLGSFTWRKLGDEIPERVHVAVL